MCFLIIINLKPNPPERTKVLICPGLVRCILPPGSCPSGRSSRVHWLARVCSSWGPGSGSAGGACRVLSGLDLRNRPTWTVWGGWGLAGSQGRIRYRAGATLSSRIQGPVQVLVTFRRWSDAGPQDRYQTLSFNCNVVTEIDGACRWIAVGVAPPQLLSENPNHRCFAADHPCATVGQDGPRVLTVPGP